MVQTISSNSSAAGESLVAAPPTKPDIDNDGDPLSSPRPAGVMPKDKASASQNYTNAASHAHSHAPNGSSVNHQGASAPANGNGKFHPFLWIKSKLFRGGEGTLRESFDEILEELDGDDNAVAPEGKTMIQNIIKSSDRTAYDVMVPKADIIAFSINTSLAELAKSMIDKPHSRYPVYGRDDDDIIGMVHIKDVFAATLAKPKRFSLKKLMREVLIVAPNIGILDLMLEMRTTKRHMALVVDEYGGIDGLVTIEDVVEEIVGDIEDEHDVTQGHNIEKAKNGSFQASSRLPLEELCEKFAFTLSPEELDEDIDTLGGLIFHLCGRVPTRGEIIAHPYSGFEFTVLQADPRRVRMLAIKPPKLPESA